MPDVKVVICLLFELRVEGWIEVLAERMELLVEETGIFGHHIMGGEVNSATEPPAFAAQGFEVAYIHVDDGCHGTVRVQDDADSGGKKIGIAETHAARLGFGQRTVYGGEQDPSFFDDVALEHPGTAPSPFGTLPEVFVKGLPIVLGELLADPVLKRLQLFGDEFF